MKKLVIAFLSVLIFLPAVQAEVDQIYTFAELKETLFQGEEVRAVIHYGDCKMIIDGKEHPAPKSVGGLPIDIFEYFERGSVRNKKAYLVFSGGSYINLKGFKFNYAKFKIYEDNRVEVTAQYAKPVTFRVVMDETFTTVINNGKNKGALFLYRD